MESLKTSAMAKTGSATENTKNEVDIQAQVTKITDIEAKITK